MSHHGFLFPALAAAGLSLLTTLTTILFLHETHQPFQNQKSPQTIFHHFRQALNYYPLNVLLPAFFFLSLGFSGLQGIFALWAQAAFNWGPKQIGFLFGYIGLIAIITQLLIMPFFVKRFGENRTLKLALPLISLGFFLIPLSIHPSLLYLANTLIVLGNSLANPSIQSLTTNSIPENKYGSVLGTLQSSASLGRIFGPTIAGELYHLFGKDMPFFTSAIIISLTSFYLLKRLNFKN